ncbi:hypothetical protein PL11201_620045 [Planktothrix sp. PCC 11201]|nr:hypothetical protein PL11201_620045 [Planktothrix sp. PCC 11201]
MIICTYHFKNKEHLFLSVNRGRLEVVGGTQIETKVYRWNIQKIKET